MNRRRYLYAALPALALAACGANNSLSADGTSSKSCAAVTAPGHAAIKSDLLKGCTESDGSEYTFTGLGAYCLVWIQEDGLDRWALVGQTWHDMAGADDPDYKAAYVGCNR